MPSDKLKFIVGLIISFVLGIIFSQCILDKNTAEVKDNHKTTISSSNSDYNQGQSSEVPDYVSEVMEYVLTHHSAPDGYVGGRRFQNRERLLPEKYDDGRRISYQEWDVHPKQKGKNRGAERLVTSDRGDTYYTQDHYKSFTKIN